MHPLWTRTHLFPINPAVFVPFHCQTPRSKQVGKVSCNSGLKDMDTLTSSQSLHEGVVHPFFSGLRQFCCRIPFFWRNAKQLANAIFCIPRARSVRYGDAPHEVKVVWREQLTSKYAFELCGIMRVWLWQHRAQWRTPWEPLSFHSSDTESRTEVQQNGKKLSIRCKQSTNAAKKEWTVCVI